MTLGEKMRALRRQMGMTQADLAGEEFTKSFISQIEKNQARPSLKSLRIFAQRLNRPVSYFLDDGADVAPTPSEAQRMLSTGELLERQGKFEEALQTYEKALAECAPTDYATRGQVYRRRAHALVELDQLPAAVQALELAAEEFRLGPRHRGPGGSGPAAGRRAQPHASARRGAAVLRKGAAAV